MNFEAQLDKYAELVVRAGLNVQQGQEVLIGGRPGGRALCAPLRPSTPGRRAPKA